MNDPLVIFAQQTVDLDALISLVLAAGWIGFGITNQGSYATLIGLLVLGTAAFMALGFALGGDADGTWDNQSNRDSFGWALRFSNAFTSPAPRPTGPIIAGN